MNPVGDEPQQERLHLNRNNDSSELKFLEKLRGCQSNDCMADALLKSSHVISNLRSKKNKTATEFQIATDVEGLFEYTPDEPRGSELRGKLELIRKMYNGTRITNGLDSEKWFERGELLPGKAAEDYLQKFPNVKTEFTDLMHEFHGNRWLRDSEPLAEERIHSADVRVKKNTVSEILSALKSRTRITDPSKIDLTMEEIFPLPDHTLPIDDGLLNMITREIVPHTPQYFYTSVLPRHYINGAVPTVFQDFLGIVFTRDPDAERKKDQIYETIAWCLMNRYDIHGAVVLFGQGGEGKSIILKVIADLLVHTSSLTLEEIETDKFKRAELYGMYANLISESTAKVIGSEFFKRLTDGTEIFVDRKRGHPFRMKNRAKFIIGTNELPIRENELRAFYRRVIAVIDFLNSLENLLKPSEIDAYVKKLEDPNELDRILSYAVDRYYPGLVERMKFTGHLNIEEAERKWEERSNPALTFIKDKDANGLILTGLEQVESFIAEHGLNRPDYIVESKDGTFIVAPKPLVITEAVNWATAMGFPAKNVNAKSIGEALISCGYQNIQWDKRRNGVLIRAWKGIFVAPEPGSVSVGGNDTETESETGKYKEKTATVSDGNLLSSMRAHEEKNKDTLRQLRLSEEKPVLSTVEEQSQSKNSELRLSETDQTIMMEILNEYGSGLNAKGISERWPSLHGPNPEDSFKLAVSMANKGLIVKKENLFFPGGQL